MQRAAAKADKRTQGVEEYLEAIFKLQRGDEPLTVRHVAERAVRVAAFRERDAGPLARSGPHGAGRRGHRPHAAGRGRGRRLVRRHRLSERFLVDYLHLPWDAVHEEACKLEHVLSPEVEARLAEQLGDPHTCPHGHAIPERRRRSRRGAAAAAAELDAGEAGVIGCVTDESGDLLRYLASLGLLPDTPVEVESVAPLRRPAAGARRPAPSTRWAARWPARSSCALSDGHRPDGRSLRAASPTPGRDELRRVCLAGNPNVGKSIAVQRASPAPAAETANYAGVTIEAAQRVPRVGRARGRGGRPARHLRP